jgi:hypothetical protein
MSTRSPARGWLALPALVFLAALAPPEVRTWLERDMARHMLIEFPLLMLAGYALAIAFGPATTAALARCDELGVASLTLASVTLGLWMIPAALDATQAGAGPATAKYATLVAAGFALAGVGGRAPLALQAFFVLGLAWMGATVGLLYQESPQQLCLYYLVDAQERAGRGLVVAAAAVAALWCAYALRASLRAAPSEPRFEPRP